MRACYSSIIYISFSCRTGDTLKIRVTGRRRPKANGKTRGSARGNGTQGGKGMGGRAAARRKQRKGERPERVRGGATNIKLATFQSLLKSL